MDPSPKREGCRQQWLGGVGMAEPAIEHAEVPIGNLKMRLHQHGQAAPAASPEESAQSAAWQVRIHEVLPTRLPHRHSEAGNPLPMLQIDKRGSAVQRLLRFPPHPDFRPVLKPFAPRRLLQICLVLACLPCHCPAADPRPAEADPLRGKGDFEAKIAPLLQRYCYDCHSDGVEKGEFAFDQHSDYKALRGDVALWDLVRQQISTHVMPPQKKEAPSLQERDAIVQWIDEAVFWFDPAKPDPGHITARRLNRVEYNNSIRDLLWAQSRPARDFPPDDTGYGYDNIGDVLSLSPMLVEKYLRAGQQVAAEVFAPAKPGHMHQEWPGKKLNARNGRFKTEGETLQLDGKCEVRLYPDLPAEGSYRLSLRSHLKGAEGGNATLQVIHRDKVIGELALKNVQGKVQTSAVEIQLPAGQPTVALRLAGASATAPDWSIESLRLQGPFQPLPLQGSRFVRWLMENKPQGAEAMHIGGEDWIIDGAQAAPDVGSISIASSGFIWHPLHLAQDGVFKLRLRASAQQAGSEPAKVEIRLDGHKLAGFEVTDRKQNPQWFEAKATLPKGKHQLQVAFTNDFYDPANKADRNLWVHELHLQAEQHKGAMPDLVTSVDRMAQRLLRRPLRAEEQTQWRALGDLAMRETGEPMTALRTVLEALLASPSFLFRTDPQPASPAVDGVAPIDEFSLASRLSYFLWSAPPDEELLKLAAEGKLRTQLDAQLRRMLGDWKASALTENFAGQWLQLRDMDIVEPERRIFPKWQYNLPSEMRRETETYFQYILRENRSILEFLDSDYSFMNERLAKYYGIKGPKSDKFEKVSLQGTPRGGVLTHGSILTLTAEPTRTSPVKRGKYLLENILGIPPPPAPGGVPPLDAKKALNSKMTLRQQLAEHRSNASCAGCHAFLDPMGFAFENFDAIGLFRDKEKGQPIDTSGQWVRGQQFKDLVQLRQILKTDLAGEFTRNLAENLLTYALGRGLSYSDRPAVKGVVAQAEAKGHAFQELILAVVQSVPFQNMRVGEAPTGQ